MTEFAFASGSTLKIIAACVMVAFLVVAWLSWARSGKSRRTLITEALRLLVAALACITLLQPELRTTDQPTTKPTIAVLVDESGSMDTLDVAALDAEQNRTVTSRRAFVETVREDRFWNDLESDNNLVFEPFSAVPQDNAAESTAGTNLNSALKDTAERHSNLRAVVVLSDGDWNEGGDPIQGAAGLAAQGVPVFGVGVGAPNRLPDLDVISVSAPAFGVVGDKMQINFTIRNSMSTAVTTVVTLNAENQPPVTKSITLPALRETSGSLFWTPSREGDTTLALDVPVQEGELITENNRRLVQVSARKETIKVLVIDSYPRWEYRFIRNALYRDPGVEVNSILLNGEKGVVTGGAGYLDKFPSDLKDLSTYDVVFLGDVGVNPDQLTEEQATLLKQLVEQQASGLVLIPGRRGNQASLMDTPLASLIPVVLEDNRDQGVAAADASNLALTSGGRQNLLTMLVRDERTNPDVWKNLPGFFWHAPVIKAKAGADVLAVHSTTKNDHGRLPMLVTTTAGTGKVLYLGIDSAWRWRKGVEDLYHYRFWGQVARWMSYQRKMAEGESLRLFMNPANPEPGTTLTLNANAYDANGVPLTRGEVIVDVTAPNGAVRRIEMTPSAGGFGAFFSTLRLDEPGEHTFTASTPSTGESVTTTVHVQGGNREQPGQPARPDVLDQISRITGGSVAAPEELPALIRELGQLKPKPPVVRTTALQFTWWWLALFIVCASGFWIARKWDGKI
ncbi:VWA domain-containing protein [Sulfuriroseicoccus oceanibius]|uniref:VWA domain-containing protein n=1 Tax=Sulfuriroseicoccus oceanibius TaxID=2707525 RepID=A0A6B3L8M6_9BACT|nr:VWA domain-containing protein [Sulfuriroseicoccus oceanibius]QQL43793.1 VWA domain-containing protein [Sulfuriroseicoccus oceanibius]